MSFLSKENIELLWDVLLDEPIVRSISKLKQEQIYNVFYNNVFAFFEKEKVKQYDLITLNKKFLSQILKAFRQEPINIKEKQPDKQIYKVEDIHSERQSIFEKQLAQKKADFESSLLVNKPPVPNFTEKIEQDKIKGMDELIARTVAQRNFDISPMNITSESEQWLKPQETSVKLKQPKEEIHEPTELKYIKIEKQVPTYNIQNDVTELALPKDMTSSKKLTWSKDNEVRYIEEYKEFKEPKANSLLTNSLDDGIRNSFNILDKLKKKETNHDIMHDTNKVELLETKIVSIHLQLDELSKKVDKILEGLNK